jgi:hypothetical protein
VPAAKPNPSGPIRKSVRLAGKEPVDFEDTTTKAFKCKELKDAFIGCSTSLQNHVKNSRVVQKLRSPMRMKPVSKLRNAAFGSNKVPTAAP